MTPKIEKLTHAIFVVFVSNLSSTILRFLIFLKSVSYRASVEALGRNNGRRVQNNFEFLFRNAIITQRHRVGVFKKCANSFQAELF